MKAPVLALFAAVALAAPAMASEPASTPYGSWLAEDIGGRGVIDNLQTTLVLGPDGQTGGRGGCNAFTGSHTLDGGKMTFGPLAATMMACPEAIMNQEQSFFRTLEDVRSWQVDAETGKLELRDQGGAAVIVLAPLK